MPSLKTSTWMSREADPCCRAQTLQKECRLIQISLPSHMWTELRHKTMIPPGLIKQNKSTFNCPIQLPRRGYPMFKMRLTIQVTCLPHMWRIQITTMSTWINLMGLIHLLFHMRKHDQPMMIHGVVNQTQSPYLEPRRQFLRI